MLSQTIKVDAEDLKKNRQDAGKESALLQHYEGRMA